ncbi:MAG: hypothetical protein WC494_01235 [Candidatus Pacearchaeota archaeon]
MGLLEFMGISNEDLGKRVIEKPRLLTEREILGLRHWINFRFREEWTIRGKIIVSGLPDADGYSIISWGKEEEEEILKFPSFYSAEQIERRAECNRERFLKDFGIVRVGENTYSLFPEENLGVSLCYPKNYDYSAYAKRLRQDEFDFKN